MAWWMLPAVVGTAVGAATGAANVGANAGTGNTARIKDLKRAKASGDAITEQSRRDIDAAQEVARRGAQQVSQDAARRAAMSGATSGFDAAQIQDTQRAVTQDLFDDAAEAFADAKVSEEQELEDRTALRKQRTIDTVNSAVGAGVGAAGGVAQMQGATFKGGKPKEPDWDAAVEAGTPKSTVDGIRKLYNDYAKGGWTDAERDELKALLDQLAQ